VQPRPTASPRACQPHRKALRSQRRLRVDRSEAIANYRDWHESLARLFSASERHYKSALYDRDPLPHYVKGRVAILGDAAHPMLPYLGQGACQAMEDGCVLAMALGSNRQDRS
jgi:salicylate hydroxylase